jgi:hypothetical protein
MEGTQRFAQHSQRTTKDNLSNNHYSAGESPPFGGLESQNSGGVFYSYLSESTGFLRAALPILKIIVSTVAMNIIAAARISTPAFI